MRSKNLKLKLCNTIHAKWVAELDVAQYTDDIETTLRLQKKIERLKTEMQNLHHVGEQIPLIKLPKKSKKKANQPKSIRRKPVPDTVFQFELF